MNTRRGLVLALGVATFLAAAKAHGHQLRLERELAGYWHVTFGGQNPAFVEALWLRERWMFWSLAAVVALVTIAFRFLAPRFAWPLPVEGAPAGVSFVGVLVLHVVFPFVVAFIVTGLASLSRFAVAARSGAAASGADSAEWLSAAAWASAGWWLVTFASTAALCILAFRRGQSS